MPGAPNGPSIAAILVDTAALAVAIAAVVFVAARGARLAAGDDRLDRATVGVLLGIVQAVGVPLLLGAAGLLRAPAVVAAHVALAVVVAVRLPAGETIPRGRPSRDVLAALVAGTALAAVTLAPAIAGRPSTQFETRHYHLANLTEWLQAGHVWGLPFQNPAFATATHPGNGELLGLWVALPTHGDQFTALPLVAAGVLAVLAAASLARELGGRPGWGALGAVGVLGTPLLVATQAYSLSTDVLAAAGLVTGTAFLLRARSEPGARWVVLAGLALGLGVGAKYTALVPTVVLMGWAVASPALRPRAVWLLPGLAALAAPWFLRNAIHTGNPIFPQGVRLAGHQVLRGYRSPLEALSTPIAAHVAAGRWSVVGAWARIAAQVYGPVLLLAAAAVGAAVVRVRRRTGIGLALGLTLVAALAYAITPFTGGGPAGLASLMGSNLRYALPALLLAAGLAPAVLPSWGAGTLAAVAVGYGAVRYPLATSARPELRGGMVAFVALAGVAVAAALAIGYRGPPSRRVTVAAAVVLWAGLAATLWNWERVSTPTALERAVASARPAGEPVLVMGVFDLRSVLGPRLDRRIATLSAGGASGETPFPSGEALDAALASSGACVLVTAEGDSPSLPPGWRPTGEWDRTGGDAAYGVYVRSASRCAEDAS